MDRETAERIYAGWLGKIIGIRLGANVEGWTCEKIRDTFGEVWDYPFDFKTFAADDDSNGPLFFLRALEDSGRGADMTAQDVAKALLNYAPYEHGFFWWGGYGISTEHTAYLNLRSGMEAPMSGSIAQNGTAVAEQIGGQIFIDTWGLVNPGNPDRAAKMAREAASVTHDGNGIYGGMFLAACIAYAFVEKDVEKIIGKGLSYIPADCEYTRVVRAVTDFYHQQPGDFRACFRYVQDNFGYDKYPGNCHIIPNTAVIILGLLYGGGDFSKTICITNMCGWDTDCNAGNAATLMGVLCGLDAIGYDKWRKPIDDVLICSSCVGSLNITDIPSGALYILKLACMLNGEELPEPYRTAAAQGTDTCHFEYPGSTHHILTRGLRGSIPCTGANVRGIARTGEGSLQVRTAQSAAGGLLLYQKTYYESDDFSDSRYDPEFSPLVYPGMELRGSVMVPDTGRGVTARLFVHERHGDQLFYGEPVTLQSGVWADLADRIPSMEGGLLDEMGVALFPEQEEPLTCYLDDLFARGEADYSLDFTKEHEDNWGNHHINVSQFSRLKGNQFLEDGALHLACSDFAETYTGSVNWRDYTVSAELTPLHGARFCLNGRVQGAIRSYGAALLPGQRFGILKNDMGYTVLGEVSFAWETGRAYTVTLSFRGDRIEASVRDGAGQETRLAVTDAKQPYLSGMIGLSVEQTSHMKCGRIRVTPLG